MGLDGLIGDCPDIVAIREQLGRLLQQSNVRGLPPILIQGETGTGKGLLANAIYRAGHRANGPFVDINCASIPETLLEAELFGFERGAFTDARQAKPGLFQMAHRGTLFLDEVGLLAEGLQGKLLKAIEERTVRRLGSTRTETVDVAILSATSEDLRSPGRATRFREDLYHRLAVLTVVLPPLRTRGQDIIVLAEHYLARACADHDLPPRVLSDDARGALLAYAWPGNVREVHNVMERAALLSKSEIVTPDLLGLASEPPTPVAPGGPLRRDDAQLEDAVGRFERDYLTKTLESVQWNISHAAARLGVARNTLRYRIEKYGLTPERTREPAAPPPPPDPHALAPRRKPALDLGHTAAPQLRHVALLRVGLTDRSPLVTRLFETIEEFGGAVVETSAATTVAAFGLEAGDDAPVRATHAAMAIQKILEERRDAAASAAVVRILVDVARVPVVYVDGVTRISADGQREALAALDRLAEGEASDAILVSDGAAPFLRARFELRPIERAGQRGYHLARATRERRLSPFVGRGDELGLLHKLLATAAAGRSQLVGIMGESGIGKSRLLLEFRDNLQRRDATFIEGRCLAYSRSVPYLPILEILRSHCGLSDTDTPRTIAEKVGLGLRAAGMDANESEPYLLHFLGVDEKAAGCPLITPEAMQSKTFAILRQLTLNVSIQRPLILAVEDLHWIDKASQTYLSSFVESMVGGRVLLLLTYRPGYRPPWMEKSYANQIVLQPLSSEDTVAIVRSVAQQHQLSEPLVGLVVDKAEGNPFLTEELTKTVMERGEAAADARTPETIGEVLMARIERLSDDAREALQAGSVLGQEFPLALLRAIWRGPALLDDVLLELKRHEFIYERARVAEPAYRFKHALTQQVTYETLPDDRRRSLHEAAGLALELMYSDHLELVFDRLAYHFSRTGPSDKAVRYLALFAEKSARENAHAEAGAALGEAIAMLGQLPPDPRRDRQSVELTLRRVESLFLIGPLESVLVLVRAQAERLARLGDDPALSCAYHFWLGRICSVLGNSKEAILAAERAMEDARRCGDSVTQGKANYVLAHDHAIGGDPARGVAYAREAIAFLERTPERWWLSQCYWVLGLNHLIEGDFASALDAQARARAIGEAIADRRLQCSADWAAGQIHGFMGNWRTAMELCKRSLSRSQDPLNTLMAVAFLGYAWLEKGEPKRALTLFDDALDQSSRRRTLLVGFFTAFRAEACRLVGLTADAERTALRAVELARQVGHWYAVGWAERVLGRLAAGAGAVADAESYLKGALRTLSSVGARFEVARTRLDLAELAHTTGDHALVVEHLRAAHREFRELRVRKYLTQTARVARALNVHL